MISSFKNIYYNDCMDGVIHMINNIINECNLMPAFSMLTAYVYVLL